MTPERAKLSRHNEVTKAMDYMLKRDRRVHLLPRRRPHLPEQQRRRACIAWDRARTQGVAVCGFRSRRAASRRDVHAGPNGQAQRRRSAWLADVLARIADHKINDLAVLLPWNWRRALRRDLVRLCRQGPITIAQGLNLQHELCGLVPQLRILSLKPLQQILLAVTWLVKS